MPKIILFFMVTVGLLMLGPIAEAQTITRVQSLSFGMFALKNNNAVHALRVSRTNVVTADSAFAIFTDPVRGEYALSGFPNSTPFTVSIPDTSLTLGGGRGGGL